VLADANLNELWARAFVEQLYQAGLRQAVISPGSRSGPLALALAEHAGIVTRAIIDERSGAFFALGMAKESGAPAAALATSGTAGANFYPAVVEAAMAHVPLLLLTADRPIELHGWGALQTVSQDRLFGQFARWFVDLGVPEPSPAAIEHLRATATRAVATALRSPRGPVQINAPFREPLAPTPQPLPLGLQGRRSGATSSPAARIISGVELPDRAALDRIRQIAEVEARGVIVCGPRDVDGGLRDHLLAMGRALGYPVLAEATSQVRYGGEGGEAIALYDLLLRHLPFADAHRPRVVLKFGGGVISKVLQAWLDGSGAEIFGFADDVALVDAAHTAAALIQGSPVAACQHLATPRMTGREEWPARFRSAEQKARSALDEAFAAAGELGEPRVAREVVAALPPDANLFVSSSMPVRDLDAFAPGSSIPLRVLANRGANGIDGVVSTALGVAASSGKPTVLLTGDLALIHDLGGWATASRQRLSLTAVVLNNDGGGIFSFLPIAQFPERFEELFATPHGLELSRIADLCGARYCAPRSAAELKMALQAGLEGGLHLIEIRTDRGRNVSEHRALAERVAQALGEGPWT